MRPGRADRCAARPDTDARTTMSCRCRVGRAESSDSGWGLEIVVRMPFCGAEWHRHRHFARRRESRQPAIGVWGITPWLPQTGARHLRADEAGDFAIDPTKSTEKSWGSIWGYVPPTELRFLSCLNCLRVLFGSAAGHIHRRSPTFVNVRKPCKSWSFLRSVFRWRPLLFAGSQRSITLRSPRRLLRTRAYRRGVRAGLRHPPAARSRGAAARGPALPGADAEAA